MQIHRLTMFVLGTCLFFSATPSFAAQNALIVIGTTGDSSVTTELGGAAQTIHDGLVQRGFAPEAIEILGTPSAGSKVTKDLVLESLKKRQPLKTTDEFWLILLGFSGRSDNDAPAFQVSGPRLLATDLKSALDSIPAQQFIFIGTSDSGGFISPLLKQNRAVLAATREEGEIDLPRFLGNPGRSR